MAFCPYFFFGDEYILTFSTYLANLTWAWRILWCLWRRMLGMDGWTRVCLVVGFLAAIVRS